MKKRFHKRVKISFICIMVLILGSIQAFPYTVGNFSENAFENQPGKDPDISIPGPGNYTQFIREAILASSEEFCYAMSTYYKAMALIERVDPINPPPESEDQLFFVKDAGMLQSLLLECQRHIRKIIDIYQNQLLYYAGILTYDYDFFSGLCYFPYEDYFKSKSLRVSRFFVDSRNSLFLYLSTGHVYQCYEYFLNSAQNIDSGLSDILVHINSPMGEIIDSMWQVSMDMSISVMEGHCFSMVCMEVLKNN